MPEVPYDAIIGNLDSSSQATAIKALGLLLTQQGDEAPALAIRIAKSLQEKGNVSVTVEGLKLLQPWRDVTEVLNLAIDLASPDTNEGSKPRNAEQTKQLSSARVFGVNYLAGSNEVRARQKLYSLVSDADAAVRDAAIAHVPALAEKPTQAEGTTLTVFQNADEQKEALELLEDLESAAHKLRDLSELNEGQAEIIDELMLPRIEELKVLLGSTLETSAEQRNARRQSFDIGGALIGTVKATAYGMTSLATAPKAYQTVYNAAEALRPMIDSLSGLIP